CPQGSLGGSGKATSIDRTERLQPPARSGHGDDGAIIVAFGCSEQKPEKLAGNERHIHGEHQVQLGRRMQERGVNAGEGSASRKALSVFAPMRDLFPPARMKPVRDSAICDIWKRISLARRYTKVTCSELPSRRKMEMFDW